jgi:hypothetical protein
MAGSRKLLNAQPRSSDEFRLPSDREWPELANSCCKKNTVVLQGASDFTEFLKRPKQCKEFNNLESRRTYVLGMY